MDNIAHRDYLLFAGFIISFMNNNNKDDEKQDNKKPYQMTILLLQFRLAR
jgi:hypothetical protein